MWAPHRLCIYTNRYLYLLWCIGSLPYVQRFRCHIGTAPVFVAASASRAGRHRIEGNPMVPTIFCICTDKYSFVDCLPYIRRFRRCIGTTSLFVPASTSRVGRHCIEGHLMVPPYSVIVPTYVFIVDCLPHVRRFRRHIGTTSVFVLASTSRVGRYRIEGHSMVPPYSIVLPISICLQTVFPMYDASIA